MSECFGQITIQIALWRAVVSKAAADSPRCDTSDALQEVREGQAMNVLLHRIRNETAVGPGPSFGARGRPVNRKPRHEFAKQVVVLVGKEHVPAKVEREPVFRCGTRPSAWMGMVV